MEEGGSGDAAHLYTQSVQPKHDLLPTSVTESLAGPNKLSPSLESLSDLWMFSKS
jgi:hypothetical protein